MQPVKELSLADVGTLTFYKPDYETFDCLGICREAVTRGGLFPAAVNSANEEANRLFREGKIGFLQLQQLFSCQIMFGRIPKNNMHVDVSGKTFKIGPDYNVRLK